MRAASLSCQQEGKYAARAAALAGESCAAAAAAARGSTAPVRERLGGRERSAAKVPATTASLTWVCWCWRPCRSLLKTWQQNIQSCEHLTPSPWWWQRLRGVWGDKIVSDSQHCWPCPCFVLVSVAWYQTLEPIKYPWTVASYFYVLSMISIYIWQSNKRAKKTYTEITVGGWVSWEFSIQGSLSRANMSDLAWAVKNGDMDQVKELVEGKVCTFCCF